MQARLTVIEGLHEMLLDAYQVIVTDLDKSFILADEIETRDLGSRLAPYLKVGDIVLLRGDLGAGKTSFARGIVGELTDAKEVPSPTYTLVQMYDTATFGIWHFDLYRLDNPSEIGELGITEAIDEGVSLIEWPERIEAMLSGSELNIGIEFAGKGRRVVFSGDQVWSERLHEL